MTSPLTRGVPAEPGARGQELTPSQRAEIDSRIIPPTSNQVAIQSSAAGIGSGWLTLEQRLRQRHDITCACTTCTSGPAADRSAESVAQEQKAV